MFYFVPASGGGQALMQRAGLAYAFDAPPQSTEARRDAGPDGLAGTVLTQLDVRDLPRIAWHKISATDAQIPVWCGWNSSDVPGPGSLARGDVLSAGWPTVTLADRREWAVPIVCPCRQIDPGRADHLPGVCRVRLDGTAAFVPEPDLDALRFALSRTLDRAISVDELISLSVRVLGIGYRVRLGEIAALGLLTQKTAYAVIATAVDLAERATAAALADKDVAALVETIADERGVAKDVAARVAMGLAQEAA